jgi:hypothetical protein
MGYDAVSVAVTDVSEALPASFFEVQTFKIRKKWTSFTLNIVPTSSSETQVFIPVGMESHTRTLESFPGNIFPLYFSAPSKK